MAEKEFRLLLQDFPEEALGPEAYLGLSKALQGQGNNDRALATIEVLEKRWPNHPIVDESRLDHGYLLLQLNRLEEAATVLTPVTRDDRSERAEAAWYFIAQAFEKGNENQKAMRIYLSLASKPLDATHSYRPYAVFAVLRSELENSVDAAVKRLEKLLAGDDVPGDLKERALQVCAVKAYATGNYTLAGDLFEKYVTTFPDSAFAMEARKGRLRALFHSGSPRDILARVEKMKHIPQLGNDPEVMFIQAATLVRENQFAPALPLLQAVYDHPLASQQIRRQAGLMRLGALVNSGNYQLAFTAGQAFAEKYSRQPEQIEALYFAGTAAFQLKKYDEAALVLNAVAESKEMSSEKRRQARELLAQCLENQDKFVESARLYRALAGKAPFDASRAALLLYAASLEEKAGRSDAALADYQSIINGAEHDGDHHLMAVNAVVRLSFKQGDFDQTTALLNQLIEKTQGMTEFRARLTLILTYLQADKLDACENEIHKAEQSGAAGSLRPELDYAIVQVAIKRQNMDRAVEVFTTLLQLPEEKQPEFRPGSLAVLAREFFKRNDFAASEKICKKWLDAVPAERRFEPTVRLADIYLATARYEAAGKILQGLAANSAEFALTPRQSARVLSLTGEALLKQGQDDQAFRLFEKSLESGGADEEASARSHWGLATLLKRANRPDEALKRAVGGFVLGNDPRYTPRCMVLAADIFDSQGKTKEAADTRAELKARFPDFIP